MIVYERKSGLRKFLYCPLSICSAALSRTRYFRLPTGKMWQPMRVSNRPGSEFQASLGDWKEIRHRLRNSGAAKDAHPHNQTSVFSGEIGLLLLQTFALRHCCCCLVPCCPQSCVALLASVYRPIKEGGGVEEVPCSRRCCGLWSEGFLGQFVR